MAKRYISNASDRQIAINAAGGHRTVRFRNGMLDVAAEAKRTGLTQTQIVQGVERCSAFGLGILPMDETKAVDDTPDKKGA